MLLFLQVLIPKLTLHKVVKLKEDPFYLSLQVVREILLRNEFSVFHLVRFILPQLQAK